MEGREGRVFTWLERPVRNLGGVVFLAHNGSKVWGKPCLILYLFNLTCP